MNKWIALAAFVGGLLLLAFLATPASPIVVAPPLLPETALVEDLTVACDGPFLPSMYRHGYDLDGNPETIELRVFGPFVLTGGKPIYGPVLVWITYDSKPGAGPVDVYLTFPGRPVERITFQALQERYADVCAVYEQWKASVKTPV